MNLFRLSNDPGEAARAHYDKHVVKMILETAQLLSTAHHLIGVPTHRHYRATHKNHPCAVWVRESRPNYMWAFELLKALCAEYRRRYNKVHKTEGLVPLLSGTRMMRFPGQDDTTPPQAMPDEYRGPCVVTAYRLYYRTDKAHLWAYRGVTPPEWNCNPRG